MSDIVKIRPDWRALYRTYIFGTIVFIFAIALGLRAGSLLVLMFFAADAALARLSFEYVIEEDRIIVREGLFSRTVNEIRIKHIRGLQVRQNIIDRMLAVGTLVAVTAADEKMEMQLRGVRNPEAMKEMLSERMG